MANFTAIAGVSRTLRTLLRDRMEQAVDITIAPPDVAITGVAGQRINLYLYQLSENGSLKNQEIPGQGHPGAYGHPPLSLDLLYLLTAFGSNDTNPDSDLQAQQSLGDAMRVFHDFPLITDSMHVGGNPEAPLILDTALVGEFERLKITLQPATVDEFAKIWSAMPLAQFRRSVAYQVSMIQIESLSPRRPTLPVRERRVYALPLETPLIAEVRRAPPFEGLAAAVAESGDTILILGQKLAGEGVNVRLGETSIPIAAPQQGRIGLTVPVNQPAGMQTVRVVRDMLLLAQTGQPPVPHRGVESNVGLLLVIPRITAINPATAGPGDLVTLTVEPPVLSRQAKHLLLGEVEITAEPMPPDAPPSPTVDFRLPTGLPAGTYLQRFRVDGAESRLTVNVVTQQYDGPVYTVTP